MPATKTCLLAVSVAALAALAGPARAQSEILRADAACQAAAKARKIQVAGVESVRAVGSDRYDVTLRTNKDPVVCRYDADKNSVDFPTAKADPKAEPKNEARADQGPNARAIEACAAEARRRDIRLGEINAIKAVGGDIDVHYLRGVLLVKPQHCRYVPSKNAAYFESVGKLPEPTPVAKAKGKAWGALGSTTASDVCLQGARSRGFPNARVVSTEPHGEDATLVLVEREPKGFVERCRYNHATGGTDLI